MDPDAGSYAISVDGQRAAKLPRSTYAFVVVEAGIHVLQSTNVKFDLTAEAGHKYYVVVAYRPEKSWAVSLVGHSFFFGEVPEEKGQAMLRGFTYKGT